VRRLLDHYFSTLLARDCGGGVLEITLNRPQQRNAVDEQMHAELLLLAGLLRAEPDVGAVLLTGAGDGFCAGGDFSLIEGHRSRDPRWSIRAMDEGAALIRDMLAIRPPLVCAINGHAMGLGATLALLGDYTVMSASARIADNHVKVGLVAGDGGTLLWPALIGPLKAKELLMLGRPLSAAEALDLGLVNAVCDRDKVVDEALAKAREFASGPRQAIAWTKQLINSTMIRDASEHMALALALEARSMALPDFDAGLSAAIAKAAPAWPSTEPEGES
jgi:enoyl-CoA hydratase